MKGVYRKLPAHEYHAGPGVSNSMLSDMAKSPAHFYALHLAPGRPPRAQTAAMAAGTLAHMMLLEPNEVPRHYIVRPDGLDGRTKDGKEWLAQAGGLTVLTAEQYNTAEAQRDAVLAVPELAALLRHGEAEVSAYWTDESTGTACRCRPDFVHDLGDGSVMLLDAKTAKDASPEGFGRSIHAYGYHRQAAMYSQGYEQASGKKVAAFVFGVVTTAYPFLAGAYVLDDESLAQGYEEVAELLAKYTHCTRTGTWPGYGPGYHLVGLPKWARRSNEIEVSYVD